MKPVLKVSPTSVLLAFLAVCFSLHAVACTISSPDVDQEQNIAHSKSQKQSNQSQYVPGQLLIKFNVGVTPERAMNLLQQHGALVVRDYAEHQLYLVALPDNMNVDEGIEIFSKLGDIEFAEPNHIYKSED